MAQQDPGSKTVVEVFTPSSVSVRVAYDEGYYCADVFDLGSQHNSARLERERMGVFQQTHCERTGTPALQSGRILGYPL